MTDYLEVYTKNIFNLEPRQLDAKMVLLCQQQSVSPKHVNIHISSTHCQYDAMCNMLISIQFVEECADNVYVSIPCLLYIEMGLPERFCPDNNSLRNVNTFSYKTLTSVFNVV